MRNVRIALIIFLETTKIKLMEQLFLTMIVLLISIAIIFTSATLGGLLILAFLVLYVIPILIKEILEIIKNIDK